MTPRAGNDEQARWLRVKDIFSEVSEADPARRDALLQSLCGADTALAEDVRSLLTLHAKDGLALDRPAPPTAILADLAPPHRHNPGERIASRFRIERFLCAGGMGEVYAATDLETSHPVALKFMHAVNGGHAQALARFRREVDLARSIQHPNVCRTIDVGGIPAEPFCVMDLLDGQTLAARLQTAGPFSPQDALPCALQICDGLAAAHAAGVIHRDLKPGNIFLLADRAVIIDFGLAAINDHTSSLTSAGAVIGTLAYLAPEQLEGAPASFASDIYALGVILHEMLAGAKPHDANSPLRLVAQKARRSGKQARVTGVPPVWAEVIGRCLHGDPAKRYQSPAEVRRALERRTPSLAFTLRRPQVLWPAAAAAAILAGSLAWSFAARDYQPTPAARDGYQQAQEALTEAAPLRAARVLEPVAAADPHFVNAWSLLAVAYAETDQLDKARDAVLNATTAADRRWRLGRVERQSLHAARAVVMRDFAAAAGHYKTLADSTAGPDRLHAQLSLGRTLDQSGKTDNAIQSFESVVAENPQNAAARLRLARLLARKNQQARAATELAQAGAIFRANGNLEGDSDVLLARAAVLRGRSLEDEAADVEQVLAHSRKTGDAYHRIAAQFRLANIAERRFQYEQAAAIAIQAADLARRENMPVLAAQAMSELGYVFLFQRQPARAVPVLREAVAMAEHAKGYATVASARMRLGEALTGTNDLEEAIAVMRPAIEWYRQGTYDDVLPYLLIKWGTAHSEEHSLKQRIQIFEEALALAARSGDEAVQAMALQRLANTAVNRDLRQALSFNERALPFARQAGNHGAIIQAAAAPRRLGDLRHAGELLAEAERALASYPESVVKTVYSASITQERALAVWQQGDCAEALRLARQAHRDDPFSKAIMLQIESCAGPASAGAQLGYLAAAESMHAAAKDGQIRAKISAASASIALRARRWEQARQLAERGIAESAKGSLTVLELENTLIHNAALRNLGKPADPARALELSRQVGFDPPEKFGNRYDFLRYLPDIP